jgi:tetratricopeptide (TPR) repeat protein
VQVGRLDEGIPQIQASLDFYQKGGYERQASQALLLLARADREKGDYASSLQAFERLLERAGRTGDAAQLAVTHDSMGVLLMEMERYPEALAHFDESRRVGAPLDSVTEVDFVHSGGVLWRLGRYEEAREALRSALSLARKSAADTTVIHLLAAQMALSERDYRGAAAESQKAIAPGTADAVDVASAKATLGLSRSRSGDRRSGIARAKPGASRAGATCARGGPARGRKRE